jgi:hypothetical protein
MGRGLRVRGGAYRDSYYTVLPTIYRELSKGRAKFEWMTLMKCPGLGKFPWELTWNGI